MLDSADWTRQYFDDTLADLSRISLNPPEGEQQHPDVIVWPESCSGSVLYTGDPLFRAGLTQIATSAHAFDSRRQYWDRERKSHSRSSRPKFSIRRCWSVRKVHG